MASLAVSHTLLAYLDPLSPRIGQILGIRAQEQVLRPNAFLVVAVMADE